MSSVPFNAFVDPSSRLGPIRRFPGGPAIGLLVRREPTWAHCPSISSSTVSASGAGGVELKIKVLFVTALVADQSARVS